MRHRKITRQIVIYAAALFFVIWTVIPIYWMFNISIMYRIHVQTRPAYFFPEEPTLFNYKRLLGWDEIVGYGGKVYGPSGHANLVVRGLQNSLIISVITVIVTMIISLPVAYAMGRLKFRFKNALLFGILFSRSYPPIAMVIPFFILTQRLGLRGTYVGMVILYLSITIPLVVWIMMGFFTPARRSAMPSWSLDTIR